MSETIGARVDLDRGPSPAVTVPLHEPPVPEQRLREESVPPSGPNIPSRLPGNLPIICLVASGAIIGVLLAIFVLVFVNFPDGYNNTYGLSLGSIPLYRALWAYPIIHLSAREFPIIAGADILALWAVYLVISVVAPKV